MFQEIFGEPNEEDGWFYVWPRSLQNNGKYLIRTKTRAEALDIQSRISRSDASRLPTPLEDVSRYRNVKQSGDTPIYELK